MGKKKKHNKDEQIHFKVTTKQKDRYERAADQVEMSLSEWIRFLCNRESAKILGESEYWEKS